MAVERSSGPFPFRRLTEGFSLRGVGLHSGRDCVLTVEPCDGGPLLRHEGAEMPLGRLGRGGGRTTCFRTDTASGPANTCCRPWSAWGPGASG